ncbi:MAG: hypothetical protein EPN36_14370 [Rhodanobacteraceae bacterium]|nr:MAG: hypothetical protein EPN36_14370 [Rhodanobacteraceae bacterium]
MQAKRAEEARSPLCFAANKSYSQGAKKRITKVDAEADDRSAHEIFHDSLRAGLKDALAALPGGKGQARMLRHVAMSEAEGRAWAAMNAGHAELEKLCEGITIDNARDLERVAAVITQRAAFLSAYLGRRGANGYSDRGHDEALFAADMQVKRVRKTLGYSYP